ncbi:MAG TPA: heparan-alpha-glucosaminide N-acetyltransferase domain-containing protein [Candidatus Solibacter sp.]|nr:heparan-alpha-glucosaminide N-acetyltransferase domain-containing protein [Candidatus Solibacter sp.]
MQAVAAPPAQDKSTATRIQSVDLLRGIVMIIMALDHVRDFFHTGAYHFSPEDLRQTYGFLFFTRWITHFCAPTFVFLSGVSVRLAAAKRPGRGALAKHLIARGLWLIYLEWTVFEFMWTFNFHYQLVVLQVIWVIGWGMILLAGLIWLPERVVAVLAVATILLHNAFDRVSLPGLWAILHRPILLKLGTTPVFELYPLIPWVAVLAAGYCFAPVFRLDDERRRRILIRLGLAMTAAFFVLRFANIYGDPQLWSTQRTFELTAISFFRTLKYPPSLIFLLMTLGPAMFALGLMDRVRVSERNPLRVFGRVPMFYYACHFYLIHATALVFSYLRYGRWDYFLHMPGALIGLPDPTFPQDWGYNLAIVYVIWVALVTLLYFPCRWMLGVKQRSRAWWLSYV